ncbi:hypothetical protein CCMSSC00406_0004484 [Pleurotus cornucopiae]|uniref:Uncharacterized protein n=1 Tax=Pleurotus cornucopiae TaxID=5321 RepID=A0ACB7J0U2_PLECO|nr:hypothetical protein CCMSSC00406_0004484 [Pleurotus cornucopiae]
MPLLESLQTEFCPPLDTALVAALFHDYDTGGHTDQLHELYSNLRDLAAQANLDESRLQDEQGCYDADTVDGENGETTNSEGTAALFVDASSATTSNDTSLSPSEAGSQSPQDYSFTSPIGFLQTILPGVPLETIQAALKDAGIEGDHETTEVEMWDVIDGILSVQYIQELEERGIEALDEEGKAGVNSITDGVWRIAGAGKKKKGKEPQKRAKPQVSKILTLGDVRQHQPTRKRGSSGNCYSTVLNWLFTVVSAPAAFDPWAQISSICSHLSTLIPSQPSSFFNSYFHSPSHSTPYSALRAALATISAKQGPPQDGPSAVSLLEIILPSYPDTQTTTLQDDINISILATGSADSAIDLVKLLRELDNDYDHGNGDRGMAVYHQNVAPISRTPPSFPPPVPPPPIRPMMSQPSSPVLPKSPRPDPFAWKHIPERKVPHLNPLALSIPAYNPHGQGGKGKASKSRQAGNTFGKGGKGDVGELGYHNSMRSRYIDQRNEMLRKAAQMWQKAPTRGGALYYAEQAREFQELARKAALSAAKEVVEAKRVSTPKQDTIDLHGTSIVEAATIVEDTLKWYNASPGMSFCTFAYMPLVNKHHDIFPPCFAVLHDEIKSNEAKPLRIITGRGNHSVNQVGVLKPAIRKKLQQEHWDVRGWDGGLVVLGKK